MTGNLQPLVNNQKISKPDGTPTDYFIRWAQERQIDIQNGISTAEAQALIDAWAAQRDIIAGIGLDGGGNLSADVTLDMADTAVTPGTYGDASNSAQITIDQQGRITAATDVPISGGGGGGGGTLLPFPADVGMDVGNNSGNIGAPALIIVMAFASAATAINGVYLAMRSTIAGLVAIPVIYDAGDVTLANPVPAGATLAATGPAVSLASANTVYFVPLTAPFTPTAGHAYYVGFTFSGAAGNFTCAPLGSGRDQWFTNAGTLNPAPNPCPAVSGAFSTALTPYWTG